MKRNLAFGPINFILLGISMALVIIGFILMSGDSSTAEAFNAEIFSKRRIVVAPVVCLFGFLSMIVAVMYRSKDKAATELEEITGEDNLQSEKTHIDNASWSEKTQMGKTKQSEKTRIDKSARKR